MTRHENDDIGSLFKAIGAKNKQFKEFSTQNNAVQAQERWPLFKTIDLEKRPPPPQLQSADKKHWEKQGNVPAPVPAATRKTGMSLGNKIAKGLHKLAHSDTDVAAPATSQPVVPPVFAAPAKATNTTFSPRFEARHQEIAAPDPAPSPALHTTPKMGKTRLNLSRNASEANSAGTANASSTTSSASAGLFAAKPAPPRRPLPGKRLGAEVVVDKEQPASPPPARSLFGQRAASSRADIANPSAPVSKKSLFGKVALSQEAEPPASTDQLSGLFARLGQPEPAPEPGKGLFGRKRKS